MNQKNVFAYTETNYQTYPAYISLNYVEGKWVLSVRGKEQSITSTIEIPAKELRNLEHAIFEWVA